MKNPDIPFDAFNLAEAARQAILDSERLGIDRFAEDAMKALTQQHAMLGAYDIGGQVKYLEQASALYIGATHHHILENFAKQREWLKPLLDGMDLMSINRAIGIGQTGQAWADTIARDQVRIQDLLGGFDQVRQVASQFDSAHALASGSLASHASALQSSNSMAASMFDPSSFGASVLEKIGAIGLGDYSKQLTSVLDGIDFDALRSIASNAGTVLANDLVEEDSVVTDEPPSTASLDEAIEHANLSTVREAVDEAVGEALRKALVENPSTRFSPAFLYIFMPIFCAILSGVVGAIGSALLTRWLAQQDSEDAAKKASITQVKTKPATRFLDHLAVKSEALPLRMGPRTTERTITVLTRGQMVEVLKRKGLWARVRYIDLLHPGVEFTGWIKIKQTQRVEDETIRRIWCALTESVSRDADECEAD